MCLKTASRALHVVLLAFVTVLACVGVRIDEARPVGEGLGEAVGTDLGRRAGASRQRSGPDRNEEPERKSSGVPGRGSHT